MKHTPQEWVSEQTKKLFPRKNEICLNCLKHQNNQNKYFHNFEAGQRVLEFGQRDG